MKVAAFCRETMTALFGDMDTAMRYAYYLRRTADKSGTFFWSVFTAEEILRNVYIAADNGGENGAE